MPPISLPAMGPPFNHQGGAGVFVADKLFIFRRRADFLIKLHVYIEQFLK